MGKELLKLHYWVLSLILISGAALAKVTDTPIDELEPSRQQRQTAIIITKVMQKYHYKDVKLDKALASDVLDRYFESLDPNKSFFIQQDIIDFEFFRGALANDLNNAHLEPAFDIFKRLRLRVDQRVDYALELLEKNQFDFMREESYRFNRDEADWGKSETAMHEQWRQRIKNDILALRLADKEEAKIAETLGKRYANIKRRTHQFNSDDIFQVFMNAYTLTIEPHTAYMSPERSENFDIAMRLSLQGIGAVLRSDGENTKVQKTVPGGPADSCGQIHSGDKIIGVAQGKKGEMIDIIGWRLQDVVEKIRGEKGTLVRLSVIPKSAGDSGVAKEVSIIRDKIKLEDQAAKKTILENLPGLDGKRFGVIDIPAFYRDFRGHAQGAADFRSTTKDVRILLAELAKEKVDGVIVDLRQNGGGSLTEATELTGLFIKKGPVVQVKDSHGRVELEQDTDPALVYAGPLAVLVNRNSASASEIFAGAIQDYNRGLIIGEPTFGKGTVQTLIDLSQFSRGKEDLGRLRLTIAQFFRVQGASTQHKGVIPDVVFPTANMASDYGEKSLDNALPWAAIPAVAHDHMGIRSLPALNGRSSTRVSQDPGFGFLVDQELAIKDIQDKNSVTLVESARRKDWSEREARQLQRRNKLRTYRGLSVLTDLDKEDDEDQASNDEDPEGINLIMQEEAARILADYIQQYQPVTAQAFVH